jgi:DNA-binding CsgD family transcriptional regulator/PAS domain-containing protein
MRLVNWWNCNQSVQKTAKRLGAHVTVRLSNEALSSIIGDIYDCVMDPAGWPAVLTRITTLMDAAYTTISLANAVTHQGRMAAHSPWDPEQLRVLNEDYGVQGIPGLLGLVMGDVDTPWATLTSMPEDEFQQSPFYQNWVRPQGLRDACIVKFVHTPDRIGLMGCITRNTRDIVSKDEQRFMELLSPHLRRAAMIGDLLDEARVVSKIFRDTLDRLATPIILADANGMATYANAAAERMFADKGALTLKNSALAPQNPAVLPALRDAIKRAAASDHALGARGIGLPLSLPHQPPAVAYVLPLSSGTQRDALRPASAAIFISTTTSAAPLPQAVLTTLFDLTPAEARLMAQIGSGAKLDDAATALNISHNTAKTHMSRIFAKTNTTRQVDVVNLVRDIAAPASA